MLPSLPTMANALQAINSPPDPYSKHLAGMPTAIMWKRKLHDAFSLHKNNGDARA